MQWSHSSRRMHRTRTRVTLRFTTENLFNWHTHTAYPPSRHVRCCTQHTVSSKSIIIFRAKQSRQYIYVYMKQRTSTRRRTHSHTHTNINEVENEKILFFWFVNVCANIAMASDNEWRIFIYNVYIYPFKSHAITTTPKSTYFCLSLWIGLCCCHNFFQQSFYMAKSTVRRIHA